MPKSINLTGTAKKTYDLDAISADTRSSGEKELLVQVWYWNPDGLDMYKDNKEEYENHKNPNPPNPEIGQIWLSKLVKTTFKK